MSGDALDMTGRVGPVLEAGEVARAIIDAIQASCPGARVVDRGSYWRVLVAGRCRVTRAAIEACLGRTFVLPGDLERVMPSFKGKLLVSDDEVSWS
jgi:hypothetical protein